jgi:UDPglucose--hexose-1-phosphate uridylyltransferase
MSELRQDRTSGGWVIIAPRRGRRPQATAPPARPAGARPRLDPKCPFCPGHESELPGILDETPASNESGWNVRVVPNKFAAVEAPADVPQYAEHVAHAGYGFHEVIIESPRHDAEFETLPADERQAAMLAYRDRSRVLFAEPRVETVVLYRNHGPSAGASLLHPHAQAIALEMVPPRLAALSAWGRRHHAEHGVCATCEELQIETRHRTRVVEETERFIGLVPFAAEHAYETWIVPLDHQAAFIELDEDALAEFGGLLARSLRRLKTVLNDPFYNFAIDSAPKHEFGAAHFHWRLRLVPQVAIWGGFELGGGLPINPSSPEDDAAALRAAPIEMA